MIIIKPDGKLKVWRKSSEIWRSECLGCVAEAPSTNLKIMVWGCLTYHGVGTLAIINGNMNSVKYIETLDNNLWQIVANILGIHLAYSRMPMLPVIARVSLRNGKGKLN